MLSRRYVALCTLVLLVGMVLVGTATAAYTVTVYANHDGYAMEGSPDAIFPTLRAGAGDANSDNGATYIYGGYTPAGSDPLYNYHMRGMVTYQTGDALPDDAVITSVRANFMGAGKASACGQFDFYIVDAFPTNDADYANEDYTKTTLNPLADPLAYASFSSSGWNNITLTNTSTISKTANTTLMLTHGADVLNQNLTWASGGTTGFQIRSIAYSSGAVKPSLTITYYNSTPATDFTADVTTGAAPLTVQFTDTSTNSPTSWAWDFGDLDTSQDLTSQNPSHIFAVPGNYTINLTATNSLGAGYKVKPVYIKVTGTCYGANCNPTGNPIGGGGGYSNIYTADNASVTMVVNTTNDLLVTLSNATAGNVIFVDGNIDLNGTANVAIPQGVTLAGDRGYQGSRGALINKTINSTAGWIESMFTMKDGSRITGLWLQGEMKPINNDDPSDRWYLTALRVNDATVESESVEIDNNEIEGWSLSGVQDGTSSDVGGYVHLHHNYIHYNIAKYDGCGIAVVDGSALIEANLFDYNRHSVAGGGYPNESYVARYNLELNHDYTAEHMFDVHLGLTGGNWYNISYNTFQNALDTQEYIHYRGHDPATGMWVYNNVFNWSPAWSTRPMFSEANAAGRNKTYVSNNVIGAELIPTILKTGPIGVVKYSGDSVAIVRFSQNQTVGFDPLTVQFTDTSTESYPAEYEWTANDVVFSTDQNPTNTFTTGNYSIKLNVTTTVGSNITAGNEWVNVSIEPLIVSFSGVQSIPSVGKKQVVLTDTSTGATVLSRIWTATEIGNSTPVSIGTTSPLTRTFGPGNYSIVLNASAAIPANSTAANTYWVNVSASDSSSVPVVDFSANATAICYGAAVAFTDSSTNVSSWSWTFGDGATSTEQSPTHVYNISSGYFTVALTGTNGLGSDTETKTNYIEVQGSCSGGGTTPTTRPFSSATGQTTILAALSIIGTGLIVFGAVFVYAAFKNQSTAGLTLGIFVITLGAIILIMSYAVISPIMNLV